MRAILPACSLLSAAALSATLSNVAPRLDVNGVIVNAHSGGLYRFPRDAPSPDLFYLYGTKYPMCHQNGHICEQGCGYYNNSFVVYTSPDLETWTLAAPSLLALPDAASVEYDEANVGWNRATGDYVMSFWSGHFGFVNNSIAMARARSATGPFVAAPDIVVRGASVISDTVALWVDEFGDGAAYVRYNTRDAPLRHMVERLTADWRTVDVEFEPAQIFAKPDFPWYDGGGMWRLGSKVYVQLSFDCCFCDWGSDALVFSAPSPLGPWTPQGAPAAARRTPMLLELPPLPPATRDGGGGGGGGGACDLSGAWSGSLGGAPIAPANLFLAQAGAAVAVTGAVTTTATYFAANASIVFDHFPGMEVPLVGAVGAFPGSDDACSLLRWLPPYSPSGSFWCRFPSCAPPIVPPANWSNEVNFCADGEQPPAHVADMTINPCSQSNVSGSAFTVPAQQFNVITLRNDSGGGGPPAVLYYGERFRSAASGKKGEDFSYMASLQFDAEGNVLSMQFVQEFTLEV